MNDGAFQLAQVGFELPRRQQRHVQAKPFGGEVGGGEERVVPVKDDDCRLPRKNNTRKTDPSVDRTPNNNNNKNNTNNNNKMHIEKGRLTLDDGSNNWLRR